MSETPMIYTALAQVMDDIQAVPKAERNEHQKFMFRGIDSVVNAVGPALRKHKVIVSPELLSVSYDSVQTTTGKVSTACRVTVKYTFTATDGSSLSTSVAAESWDSGDKATAKAMSVAFRTALLQALCLPTDEPDPDHDTFERVEAPIVLQPLDVDSAREQMATASSISELNKITSSILRTLVDDDRVKLQALYDARKSELA